MTYDVLNPATEKVIRTIELAGEPEADAAIAKAAKAFETWRDVNPADRGRSRATEHQQRVRRG